VINYFFGIKSTFNIFNTQNKFSFKLVNIKLNSIQGKSKKSLGICFLKSLRIFESLALKGFCYKLLH